MKLNSIFKSLISVAFLAAATQAQAGREGVSYYYGIGLGAMQVDEPAGSLGLDTAIDGNLFFGLEEDGWALEYMGFRTADTGTDVSNLEYRIGGNIISLGYRTLETGSTYYKFAYGQANADVDVMNTTTNGTVSGSFDANVYTVGWGMRLQSKNRFEVNYSYIDASGDETNTASKIHMINARYMWGGSEPSGR
mgnify:CR=1 FL=1